MTHYLPSDCGHLERVSFTTRLSLNHRAHISIARHNSPTYRNCRHTRNGERRWVGMPSMLRSIHERGARPLYAITFEKKRHASDANITTFFIHGRLDYSSLAGISPPLYSHSKEFTKNPRDVNTVRVQMEKPSRSTSESWASYANSRRRLVQITVYRITKWKKSRHNDTHKPTNTRRSSRRQRTPYFLRSKSKILRQYLNPTRNNTFPRKGAIMRDLHGVSICSTVYAFSSRLVYSFYTGTPTPSSVTFTYNHTGTFLYIHQVLQPIYFHINPVINTENKLINLSQLRLKCSSALSTNAFKIQSRTPKCYTQTPASMYNLSENFKANEPPST